MESVDLVESATKARRAADVKAVVSSVDLVESVVVDSVDLVS